MRRRELLVNSTFALLAASMARATSTSSGSRLRLLILGSTRFLGIHTVAYALARSHEVTIFTRGQHEADLGDQVKKLSMTATASSTRSKAAPGTPL